MKKFFEYLGIFALMAFSFFYTEKTANMVLELDNIMIKLKEEANNYAQKSINAIIENDSIIPGISAKKVNISKSYKKMKEQGFYSDKQLIYDYEKPNISLEDNGNKYIIKGNEIKKMVSLIFIIEGNTNIDKIVSILDNNNAKASFFIDNNWLQNNIEKATLLINKGHNLGNLSNKLNYQDSAFLWINSITKKVLKQEKAYCLKTDEKKDIEICNMNNAYTINPIYIDKKPLINTKKELTKGSLIAYKVNEALERELDLIIKYILTKDLEITSLTTHLTE